MSFALDANILIYASDETSVYHRSAKAFLWQCVEKREVFCLPWSVVMAYLRITTHPGIFTSPLTPKEANENIESLLNSPYVRLLSEGDDFWRYYRDVTNGMVVRGNLVPDAHIAAVLLQHGIFNIVTNDSDFRRFDFLKIQVLPR